MEALYAPDFEFIGKVHIPKESSKVKFFREWETTGKNGKTSTNRSIRFFIAVGNSTATVDLFGQKTDTIKYRNEQKELVEIPWSERTTEDAIAAYYPQGRLFKARLSEEEDVHTFISAYDMIGYLYEHLTKCEKNISVKGTWRRSQGTNGKWYDNFEIQRVYLASDTEKPKLKITADVWYNKSCVVHLPDEKKYVINGLIPNYIPEEKKTMFLLYPFVYDYSNVDMKEDEQVRRFNLIKSFIDIKAKTMNHMSWIIKYENGAEEVEFDESMLTEKQKESIALGLYTIDDFKPKGNIIGNRITEMRLLSPNIRLERFKDGLVDSGIKEDDFYNEVYYGITEESKTEETNDEDKKESSDLSEDELF